MHKGKNILNNIASLAIGSAALACVAVSFIIADLTADITVIGPVSSTVAVATAIAVIGPPFAAITEAVLDKVFGIQLKYPPCLIRTLTSAGHMIASIIPAKSNTDKHNT